MAKKSSDIGSVSIKILIQIWDFSSPKMVLALGSGKEGLIFSIKEEFWFRFRINKIWLSEWFAGLDSSSVQSPGSIISVLQMYPKFR